MDLDAWLAEHIGCEQRRAEVRANVDCLSDFRVASLEDLEDALGLAAWPALPKKRFLDAWRRLKDGEDEAAPSSEPQRPRSAPVSAAELAAAARGPPDEDEEEEDEDDEEEDVGGRTPSRSDKPRGNPRACEVRRVGDKKWRRFASRADAVAAFPDLRSQSTVSRLITDNPRKRPTDRAPADIRERFEARNVPRRPRSPPVSAAALAAAARGPESDEEDSEDEDEDEDVGGRALSAATLKNQRACEVRRVGDKKWRRFASRKDAAAAFPELSGSDISKLITKPTKARPSVRGMYEARSVGGESRSARGARDSDSNDEEDSDDDDDAPTTARGPRGQMACEMRRVGDKKWRRFASRADAARAFPGLYSYDIGNLINNKKTRPSVHGVYEARSVGGESRSVPVSAARGARDSDSDDEDDDDDDEGATRGKIIEMRRVGDASWRKFAHRGDAARAFGLSRTSVERLVNKTSDAPSSRFEARQVDGDIADVEDVSQIEVKVVAVGDRVEVDGEPGVVTSIGENQHRCWKVRLDGEAEARNCRRSQITKDGSPVAAPAPVPMADDADDDEPRPPAPPRTFALPSLPADACEVRRVGDADWRRFASRADAARAFGGVHGLDAEQIGKLIDDSPVKPSRERPKRAIRDNFEARAAADTGAPFEAVPLEDECVICQKSTLEADDTPMQDVLLCDVCEGDVHLACTSLSKIPGEADAFTCSACAAAQGDDAAPAPMDASPPAPAPAADDFDELYSEVAAAAPAAAAAEVAAPGPAPAAADGEDWGSASFGMSTAAPAPAPAPVPPTAAPADDKAPPAKRARLDDLLGPPPAEEAPAPAIPNDGSFLATMKQALAAPPSPALPAPAPPVLQPIAPPPSMTPTNGGVLQPIVLAPSSPPPPPPVLPSSPASWPTLSDVDKSRVEALSHSCPAAAGRLAEALSRRAAPAAPTSPLAPAAQQPAPPGTPDAKFQEAVAML
ncbi:unnamed protein product [Pelagomonas calceolata]|uniref:Zinc finger PHD-type domain-containing protein n=2 Tax=Pelagomonas calceolata TaxID=35677 RepID=A0A8J2SJP4_9STRA|nr:unnamed protein product [Pelagomonas calceolata]